VEQSVLEAEVALVMVALKGQAVVAAEPTEVLAEFLLLLLPVIRAEVVVDQDSPSQAVLVVRELLLLDIGLPN
jgi:hypothetical protein